MVNRSNRRRGRGFNIFLSSTKKKQNDDISNLNCAVHPGRQLVRNKEKDPTCFICPDCGLEYLERELIHETGPASKFGISKGPKLFQANRKRILTAEDGNPIPIDDELIKQDMMQGRKVLSYQEFKIDE